MPKKYQILATMLKKELNPQEQVEWCKLNKKVRRIVSFSAQVFTIYFFPFWCISFWWWPLRASECLDDNNEARVTLDIQPVTKIRIVLCHFQNLIHDMKIEFIEIKFNKEFTLSLLHIKIKNKTNKTFFNHACSTLN